MKLAWKILVGLGAVMVFISLGMDTTVSTGTGRVHNIGLQHQQQTFLILGCFLFLAGIVLFAVFKIKQTPEQEAAEETERQAAAEVTKLRAEDLSAKAVKVGSVLGKVRAGIDNLPGRLCAGVAAGLLWCAYGGELAGSQTFGVALFCGALGFSLWPRPWRTVIARLAIANVVFLVITFGVLYFTRELSFGEETVRGIVLTLGLPILLSVALILFLRRKSGRL